MMRPHQIIAAMSQEKFDQLLGQLNEDNPEVIRGTTLAAAQILKFRPKFLMKQAPAKRMKSIRQAVSRANSNHLAEELLAVYFLKCRLPLLTEWLDLMGLEHEEGVLTQEEVPCPEAADLQGKVQQFRSADGEDDRTLLLRVFAAQAAIEWPALDELLAAEA
ncbi:MAG: hypothetical protein GY910_12460 [bacterium]|nr:hypothetical protein [Deltaproteobacteria bacterium]MCP4905783.1 hypothetical protein [bacterium]